VPRLIDGDVAVMWRVVSVTHAIDGTPILRLRIRPGRPISLVISHYTTLLSLGIDQSSPSTRLPLRTWRSSRWMTRKRSQKVDWHAPEFVSLVAQHFDLFIAQRFQGGRATDFRRVGLIKSRFCRALLSQFREEVVRKGTIIFRSQWDVKILHS